MRKLTWRYRKYLNYKWRKSQTRKKRSGFSGQYRQVFMNKIGLHPLVDNVSDGHIVINVPSVFCMDVNYSDTLDCINLIRECILEYRCPVFLNLKDVVNIGVTSALVLQAEINRCRPLGVGRVKKIIDGNYPDDDITNSILEDIGFYKSISIEPPAPRSSSRGDGLFRVGIIQFEKRLDSKEIYNFSRLFTMPFTSMENVLRQRLQGALVEAISNCFEHAYKGDGDFPVYNKRVWLTGHLDLEREEFSFVVFDQGIGIPRALPRLLWEKWNAANIFKPNLGKTDTEIIRIATTLARTSTQQAGRGQGFKTMKQLIDICHDGELKVWSNRGAYKYSKQGEDVSIGDRDQSLGGTLVFWRIGHPKGSSYDQSPKN